MWCSVPPVVSQHSPQLYDYTGVWQKHAVRDHRGVECVHECVSRSLSLCVSERERERCGGKMNMHVCLDELSVFLLAQPHCRSVCSRGCLCLCALSPSGRVIFLTRGSSATIITITEKNPAQFFFSRPADPRLPLLCHESRCLVSLCFAFFFVSLRLVPSLH